MSDESLIDLDSLQDMGIIHKDFPLSIDRKSWKNEIGKQWEQKKSNEACWYTREARINENITQVPWSWWGQVIIKNKEKASTEIS